MSHSHRPDYILIAIFAVLIIFGLIALSSASVVIGYQKFDDSYYFLKHQIFYGLIPGLILFFLAYKTDYKKLKKAAIFLLALSILLLVIIFIPGIGADFGNAKSWLNFKYFTFQPSEFVKLTLILYLAVLLSKERSGGVKQGLLLPFLGISGLCFCLVALQPDLGTALIIVLTSFAVYFAANTRNKEILFLALFFIVGMFFLIKVIPSSYRSARFEAFLNPALDPQGDGYQINQSLLAIGSGGVFGRGLGLSIQKFQYLPEPAGDSIFAIICEELGFAFSFLLVTFFLVLTVRGYKIAKKCRDEFGKLIAFGITSMFIIQAFINIGGMVNLIPLTGVPLPFISYGGSALVVSLASAGILLNISKLS
ncbi:MAG: Uncharacterized protein Athens101410_38 [Parcubacteria group bacterium Athens1014_10]|nr:MAG: Uncharacterized protein Athens101410_38 [Parcubacteria group bacterium Athens1014_10]TSD06064.1 MAG: Uncharacterized protein Athens071412_38 [Parcubacteria group bacterium Athens0714_12]